MSDYQKDIKRIRAMYDAVAKGIVDDPFKPVALGIQEEATWHCDMPYHPDVIIKDNAPYGLNVEDIKKCITPKVVKQINATKEQKMTMFLGSLAESFKKTSEEHKYCDKLVKNFEDMNFESIKFFISSNYDRFDEIHTLAKKYEENFDTKEVLKYEARFAVLSKAMMFMLQENL